MTGSRRERAENFEQFWQLYLRDHAQPLTRRLHVAGISVALAGFLVSLFVDDYGLTAIAGILIAAVILWGAHRFVERNQPTGYRRRLDWAIRCGARMYWLEVTRRLEPELKRAGVNSG